MSVSVILTWLFPGVFLGGVGKIWMGERDPTCFNPALSWAELMQYHRTELSLLCKPLPCLRCFWLVILVCAYWAFIAKVVLLLSPGPPRVFSVQPHSYPPPEFLSQLTSGLLLLAQAIPEIFIKIIPVFINTLSDLSPCLAIASSSKYPSLQWLTFTHTAFEMNFLFSQLCHSGSCAGGGRGIVHPVPSF